MILIPTVNSLSGCFVTDNIKKIGGNVSSTANKLTSSVNEVLDKKSNKDNENNISQDNIATNEDEEITLSSKEIPKEESLFDISKYLNRTWATDNPKYHTYILEISQSGSDIEFFVRFFEEGDAKHTEDFFHCVSLEDIKNIKNNEYAFSFDSGGHDDFGKARLIFNHDSVDLYIDRVYNSKNNYSISEGKYHLEQNENVYNEMPDQYGYTEASGFFFPSDVAYISEYDVAGLSQSEVAFMRNEIFARHGYIFKNEPYKSYFAKMDWYVPNPDYNDSYLTDIEKANRDFLIEYEKKMGWR